MNYNSELSDKISKFFRTEWNSSCSVDPNTKHLFHTKATGHLILFGYKIMEVQVHIKTFGPAHALSTTDINYFNLLRISYSTSVAIVSTGPLTQRVITYVLSGSSILDKLLAKNAPKSILVDVSYQRKLSQFELNYSQVYFTKNKLTKTNFITLHFTNE